MRSEWRRQQGHRIVAHRHSGDRWKPPATDYAQGLQVPILQRALPGKPLYVQAGAVAAANFQLNRVRESLVEVKFDACETGFRRQVPTQLRLVEATGGCVS